MGYMDVVGAWIMTVLAIGVTGVVAFVLLGLVSIWRTGQKRR